MKREHFSKLNETLLFKYLIFHFRCQVVVGSILPAFCFFVPQQNAELKY